MDPRSMPRLNNRVLHGFRIVPNGPTYQLVNGRNRIIATYGSWIAALEGLQRRLR